MDHLKANWKKYLGAMAAAAALYYGGPVGVEALKGLGHAIGW